MTLEGPFQLPVKSLHQPVGLGVVGSCSEAFGAKYLHEVTPESRLKLAAPVSGDCSRGPKLATHPCKNVRATVSAVMFGRGNASGQRVNLSMTVRR